MWSFNRVLDEHGEVASLIGSGVDITEQCEMAERLKRAEAMADNAVQSLRIMRSKAAEGAFADPNSDHLVSAKADRRRNERRPFPYKQCLAPMFTGEMPTPEMFREVRCQDLSSQGFSFRTPEIPDYQQLIVAFGKHGNLIYLTAEIVHITPITSEGRDMYLVGCRYIGRTSYDASADAPP
jgi:hypothetical protein